LVPALAWSWAISDYAPFNQRGGLGKAHQLFGSYLPKLLYEFNEMLAGGAVLPRA